jgi:opacity protein-like surface antigen
MKTTISTLFFFVLASGLLTAQNAADNSTSGSGKAKSFLSFSGGIAMPTGKFASNDFGDAATGFNGTSGYAKMGSHFAVEGAYFFCSHFGIGGSLSASSFNVDVTPIANGYREAFDCDSASASARPYHTINILVGPCFSWPIKKFTIDARILAGVTTIMSPDIFCTVINAYQGPTEGSVSTFVQTGDNKTTFGMMAGVGIRYAIYKHWMVRLGSDYFYSKPTLNFQNVGRTNNVGPQFTSYNQAIAGMTAVFGVGYEF